MGELMKEEINKDEILKICNTGKKYEPKRSK